MTNEEKIIFACVELTKRAQERPASFVINIKHLSADEVRVKVTNDIPLLPEPGIKQPLKDIFCISKYTVAPFIDPIEISDFFFQKKELYARTKISNERYLAMKVSELIESSSGAESYFQDIFETFDVKSNLTLSKTRPWLISVADQALKTKRKENLGLYDLPEYSQYGRW